VLRVSPRRLVLVAGAGDGADWAPGQLEHFAAYAGSAAIAMAGYVESRCSAQIIGGFWVYAAILEYLQHFSAGRHPAIGDFAASALAVRRARCCSPVASPLQVDSRVDAV